ncbi:MAG: ribonuclease HI family protein [Actinobacteria bacterium]|nr:ribonuclease HI family protein [Actinomycetota bacterium]
MDLNFDYLKIYFDGGSRGNPGPSAVGAVVYDKNDNRIDELSQYISDCTNNVAEYMALDMVLDLIKKYKVKYNVKRIILNTDSKLLHNQVKRIWKIRDEELIDLNKKIARKLKDYETVDLRLISREDNVLADRLVNSALNKKEKALEDIPEINFGSIED